MIKNLNEAGLASLDVAIALLGGPSAMARLLHVNPSAIANWRSRGRIPSEQCAAIELLTGGKIKRRALRPDVFGSFREISELHELSRGQACPTAT